VGTGRHVLSEASVAEMAEEFAVPGQTQHQSASYLGGDPADLVGQLEQSNLAYGHHQASCLEQAVAENRIPAEGAS